MNWLRRPRLLLMFLLLGAMINITVAWGSALIKAADTNAIYWNIGEPHAATHWYGGVREARWNTFVWRSPTWVSARTSFGGNIGSPRQVFISSLPLWSRVRTPPTPEQTKLGQGFVELEEARGWPCRSFVGFTHMQIDLARGGWVTTEHTWAYKMGKKEQWPGGPELILPVRPIILGFIANTALYGMALFVLWIFSTLTLRERRKLRGLCPACAYPVGISAVCTECGEPVNSLPIVGKP